MKLRDLLKGSKEMSENFLTNHNLEIIASELKNKFSLKLKKHPTTQEWHLFGTKYLSLTSEYEKKVVKTPGILESKNIDWTRPQESLPEALRFHVDYRIQESFNHLLANTYLSLKNDETFRISAFTFEEMKEKKANTNIFSMFCIPKVSKNLYDWDETMILKILKDSNCCG